MEIVLIGESKELQNIMNLLKKMIGAGSVHAFDKFSNAREYIEHHPVDLTLLDADNEETVWEYPHRKIKEINGMAKVVLVSANDMEAVRAHEVGVWDYLLKPVKRRQMERVLEKTISMQMGH